jgi:hypothetical protein
MKNENLSRYLFGRLNLLASYDSEAKKRNLILKGLRHNTTIDAYGNSYGFFEVRQMTANKERFIHGFLVKYRPMTTEEVAEPNTRRLRDLEVKDRVQAKARFFLHIHSGVISYHPVLAEIPPHRFRNLFVDLFVKSHDAFFVDADFQTIDDKMNIFEEIKKLTRVKEVSIRLHPSNPSNSELWKDVDARLKQLELISATEKLKVKEGKNGLALIKDPETISKINMAVDGYGIAKIDGAQDKHAVHLTTADKPVAALAPDSETPARRVLKVLIAVFQGIFARFKS